MSGRMGMSRVRVGVVAALVASSLATARADDLTNAAPLQRQVNAEIDAIRTSGETPSDACLSALQEMHTAEQQLSDLAANPSNAPSGSALAENEMGEVGVARDVLASDLDAATHACRADADRACAGSESGKAARSCALLSRLGG